MGIDYHSYLGPYAAVATEVIEVIKSHCHNPLYCPLKNCNPLPQFCPQCGQNSAKLDFKVKKGKVEFELYEVEYQGKTLDHFFYEDCDVCSRFYKDKNVEYFKRNFMPSTIGVLLNNREMAQTTIEISPQLIADQIQAFTSEYIGPLDILRNTFGNLDIKWGIVRWAN